jgi:GntP family gluconate:H+ symporter
MTNNFKIHPFIALFLVAIAYGIFAGMPLDQIILSINEGFGGTLGKIGLIIIFGVIIGAFLENTGGAYAIADKVLKWVGKKRVPTAMGILGYFVSIPVFADSGFILLSPLNKSLSKKAGISITGSAVALAMGLMASHTMVPPTPGPIAAAGILDADLGLVILVGIPISLIAMAIGIFYSTKFVSKTYIDPNPKVTEAEVEEKLRQAPSAIKSSLPVILPIVLIIISSLIKAQGEGFDFPLKSVILFLGEPVIALLLGMFLAFTLPKNFNRDMLSTEGWVGKALKDSATILLITGAGGVFGKILQNSGIAEMLGDTLGELNLSVWLPFILAAAIKTAQGSSTVALITAASIIAPLMSTLGFETGIQKAMVVIAIGAGSAVVSHANDSFFWVMTQMSGLSPKLGYKLYTLGSFIVGVSAGILVFISYLIFT